jgi:nitroimidazol reductase NimA-like FMN-containing flavoprotein (pyridoxamine 5'-phosphate oxidase superfamily)
MIDMSTIQIAQMLDKAHIGRLCMAGADGRPYAIPIPFCWADGAVYLRLPLSGRKGEILTENDRVCFEVDAFTETLDEYASVLVEGRLIPVLDVAEKSRVKAMNDDKYLRLRGGYRPGHGRSTPLEDLPMRKIEVAQITGKMKEPRAALVAAGA